MYTEPREFCATKANSRSLCARSKPVLSPGVCCHLCMRREKLLPAVPAPKSRKCSWNRNGAEGEAAGTLTLSRLSSWVPSLGDGEGLASCGVAWPATSLYQGCIATLPRACVCITSGSAPRTRHRDRGARQASNALSGPFTIFLSLAGPCWGEC